jgi:hypothetical protein
MGATDFMKWVKLVTGMPTDANGVPTEEGLKALLDAVVDALSGAWGLNKRMLLLHRMDKVIIKMGEDMLATDKAGKEGTHR